jgi:zinc transporter ZupT
MSSIALVGSLTLILSEETWNKISLPLIAFAAGSLIGGAIFHMIPSAVTQMGNVTELYVWLTAGFVLFYMIEEFLNWHHSHTHSHTHMHTHTGTTNIDNTSNDCRTVPQEQHNFTENTNALVSPMTSSPVNDEEKSSIERTINHHTVVQVNVQEQGITQEGIEPNSLSTQANREGQRIIRRKPFVNLIIIADAVHNFVGGMFVGASFIDSISLGLSAWLAAAAHEVPQELGDFVILVHGGCTKRQALLWNFISALTFPLGGCVAYFASSVIDVAFLIPFAAGNFLYIAGSDLIPEVKHFHDLKRNTVHFLSFLIGVLIMLGIRIAVDGW